MIIVIIILSIFSIYGISLASCAYIYKNASIMYNTETKLWQMLYAKKRLGNSIDARVLVAKTIIGLCWKMLTRYKEVTR